MKKAKEAAAKQAKRKQKPLMADTNENRKTCDDSSQNPDNDGPIDKVANWFKDIFNVCGKTSCCTSKNPYYDKKTWNDINDRISY